MSRRLRVVQLGGFVRTHEGLRHAVVAARAMNYACMLVELHRSDWPFAPAHVTERDALVFRTTARGIDTFVRVPRQVNAAWPTATLGSREHWTYLRFCFAEYAKRAHLLGARGLLVPVMQSRANGSLQESGEELRNRVVRFLRSVDLDEYPVDVLLQVSGDPLGNPQFLERVLSDLGDERFGLALGPGFFGGEVDDAKLGAYLERWGKQTRLVVLDGSEPPRTALRFDCPVVLDLPSLADQAAAAEAIRAEAEEAGLV